VNDTSRDIYLSRINLALDYVDRHLSEKIVLEDIARAAHFSSYHFHRIFTGLLNETTAEYINRAKLEKACQQLSYTQKGVSQIATDLGFSSVATFSRAFKQYTNSSPSTYRNEGLPKDSKIRKQLHDISSYLHPVTDEQYHIEIKKYEFKKLAYIQVNNSFEEGRSLNALKQLIEWAKAEGVFDSGQLMGMSPDDVTITPKDKYRYIVAISLPDQFSFEHPVIKERAIPESQYATMEIRGDIEAVVKALHYLYTDWLLSSGYEPNHLLAFEKFLNKENATDWTHFELEVALPIKELVNYKN